MAKLHKLTDTQCRSAVCTTGTVRKLADGGGLYLWITPDGARRWRYRFFVGKKEKLLSCGTYPDTTLKDARAAAAKLREQDDPGAARQAVKVAKTVAASNDFETVARAWHAKHSPHWNPKYVGDLLRLLERYTFPSLGHRQIDTLVSKDVTDVLEKIEAAGAITTAHKMLPIFGRILRYAKGKGFCTHIVSTDISAKDSLAKAVTKKHPAVSLKELPALLRKIDTLESQQTKLALKLVFLTFTRANELLKSTWDEINFDEALWRIPESRMKKRLALLVPLAPQAVAIFKELKEIGHGSEFVFPGRSYEKPMVSNTLLVALDTLGYGGEMTSHGVRRIASTTLNNAADSDERPLFSADAIERQLAHVSESVRATYNEAEYLGQRIKMMSYWADYLDATMLIGKTDES